MMVVFFSFATIAVGHNASAGGLQNIQAITNSPAVAQSISNHAALGFELVEIKAAQDGCDMLRCFKYALVFRNIQLPGTRWRMTASVRPIGSETDHRIQVSVPSPNELTQDTAVLPEVSE